MQYVKTVLHRLNDSVALLQHVKFSALTDQCSYTRLSLVKRVSFGGKWGTRLSDVAQRSINHHVLENLVAVCRAQSWPCLMRPFYIHRKTKKGGSFKPD